MLLPTIRTLNLHIGAAAFVMGAAVYSCAVTAGATTWTSDEYRCSINLPAGWTFESLPTGQSEAKLIASNVDGTKKVLISVLSAEGDTVIAADKFDEGLLKSVNGKKREANDFIAEGRSVHRLVADAKMFDKDCTIVTEAMISHDRLYSVSAVAFLSDAPADAEIRACLDSFHFLDPPDPPGALAAAEDERQRRLAAKLGQVVGWVLGIAIGIWLIRYMRKRRRA